MWFWFFVPSLFLNIFLLIYLRWLLRTVESMNEDVYSLGYLIEDFSAHIKAVHELEMFYGDETLKYLMDHAMSLNEQLEQNFEYIYTLTEAEEETDTEEEELDQEEEST